MKLVYDTLLPVAECDNRYGFDLTWFSPGAVASLIDLDCAIAVVTQGKLVINVDSGEWYSYIGGDVEPTAASVNAVLAEITFDPDLMNDEDDLDEITNAFEDTGKWQAVTVF